MTPITEGNMTPIILIIGTSAARARFQVCLQQLGIAAYLDMPSSSVPWVEYFYLLDAGQPEPGPVDQARCLGGATMPPDVPDEVLELLAKAMKNQLTSLGYSTAEQG